MHEVHNGQKSPKITGAMKIRLCCPSAQCRPCTAPKGDSNHKGLCEFHACAYGQDGQKRTWDTLELELQSCELGAGN